MGKAQGAGLQTDKQKKEVWRCDNRKPTWLLRDGKGSQIQRCLEFSTIYFHDS